MFSREYRPLYLETTSYSSTMDANSQARVGCAGRSGGNSGGNSDGDGNSDGNSGGGGGSSGSSRGDGGRGDDSDER